MNISSILNGIAIGKDTSGNFKFTPDGLAVRTTADGASLSIKTGDFWTYLSQNRREFECTKHISLAMLNPAQLIQLRDTGSCMFTFPEELFDLDFSGYYFRRIKTVSVSIPSVAGPHVTVNATFLLLKSMVRINTLPGSQYQRNQDDSGAFTDDDRFRESRVAANAVATSPAQNDSGMFELNFRDERYLPFEGAGAISTWQLELTQDPALRQFAYDTISDVILHVRYTSREPPARSNRAPLPT
jgi:hypothetical protein